MASYNKFLLMGNLTRDPEVRVTSGGLSICKFGVASTRTFKGQDGSQKEEVLFVDVDAFGKQAEVVAKYFSKGKPIFLEGRLRLDQWESNTGEKRSRHTVALESFQFVGGRNDENSGGSPYEASTPPARKQAPVAAGSDMDDDVPF